MVQIKADPDNPLQSIAFTSTSPTDVIGCAGSRYGPASPVAGLAEALARYSKVAFVGKPCDVYAVRRLTEEVPDLKQKVPYLLSFMCAGTPSKKGTVEIVEKFGLPESDIASFRYRGNGWPGLTTAVSKQGRTVSCDYNTSWGTVLNRYLQPRCKICVDGTGEFADVVGADAWHGENGYPEFEERDGRSLVITRTRVGSDLVSECADASSVALEGYEKHRLKQIQPYQFSRKASLLYRVMAMKILFRRVPSYRNMGLMAAASHLPPVAAIKVFGGTLKRAIRGRL